eukprot:scaffold3324_cov371-Prasinococcus_capsulatus_cf.AAC.8
MLPLIHAAAALGAVASAALCGQLPQVDAIPLLWWSGLQGASKAVPGESEDAQELQDLSSGKVHEFRTAGVQGELQGHGAVASTEDEGGEDQADAQAIEPQQGDGHRGGWAEVRVRLRLAVHLRARQVRHRDAPDSVVEGAGPTQRPHHHGQRIHLPNQVSHRCFVM